MKNKRIWDLDVFVKKNGRKRKTLSGMGVSGDERDEREVNAFASGFSKDGGFITTLLSKGWLYWYELCNSLISTVNANFFGYLLILLVPICFVGFSGTNFVWVALWPFLVGDFVALAILLVLVAGMIPVSLV